MATLNQSGLAKSAKSASEGCQLSNLALFGSPSNFKYFFSKDAKGLRAVCEGCQILVSWHPWAGAGALVFTQREAEHLWE